MRQDGETDGESVTERGRFFRRKWRVVAQEAAKFLIHNDADNPTMI